MSTILFTAGGVSVLAFGALAIGQTQRIEANRILMDEYTALVYYSLLFEKGNFGEEEWEKMKSNLAREPLSRSSNKIKGLFIPKRKISAYYESVELLSAMKNSSFENLVNNRALYQPKVEELKNKLSTLLH